MSMEYKIGLFCGLLTGVLVGVLAVALMKHKKVIDDHFDERQERARGQAFRSAFFTFAVTAMLYGALDSIVGVPCDTLAAIFICFCIAMAVFAGVCIRKEAYLSLYETPGKVMSLFGVLVVINLFVTTLYLLQGTMVQNGVLTFRACNGAVAVLLLLVMGMYAMHIRGGQEEDAE